MFTRQIIYSYCLNSVTLSAIKSVFINLYVRIFEKMSEKKNDVGQQTAAFLTRLGLIYNEDIENDAYWQKCWQMIKDAGGDPEETLATGTPMSKSVVNMYFMTPEIACRFLAADIPRLHQVFEALAFLKPVPASAKHIAEIGGGPGIVSLWLAQQYPEKEFTVFDYAENTIKIGKGWAKKLGIKNINYQRKSYSGLATEETSDKYDFILGLSVLDLKIEPQDGLPHLSISDSPAGTDNDKSELISDFSKACSTLLKPGGCLYFSQGGFNDAGLYNLFKSFRDESLGLDWEKTMARGEGKGASFSFKEIHIFAKKDKSSVFIDALEDLRTFLYRGSVSSFDDKIILGHSDFETYLALLSTGTKLADIRADREKNIAERYTIYVKNGMLGFFTSNTGGSRSGFIYCAAAFISSCHRLSTVIDSYKSKNIQITKEYWHPFFKL